jgi:CAI-1 autoinducer synthase
VHFITASLAKAFAGRAGFMTLPAEIRNYVLSTSYPNMFSSCLLPHEIAGLAATLIVIQRSDAARAHLRASTGHLRTALSNLGYPIHQGSEQIIALEAGTEPATMVLRDRLEERGVFGSVFCAPATSRNRTMVRLTLHAGLAAAELGHVEAVAAEIAPLVKPWEVADRQTLSWGRDNRRQSSLTEGPHQRGLVIEFTRHLVAQKAGIGPLRPRTQRLGNL